MRLKFGAKHTTIDRVWSQQGLNIPGGTSGAPVVSELDDAIVAIACAGADSLRHAFFVPLINARSAPDGSRGKAIADAIASAQDASTRLGRRPNWRGVVLRCWSQTRASVQSLTISGLYDRDHVIGRPALNSSIKQFLRSEKAVAVLAGESGVGKSASIARFARLTKLEQPVLLLRAAQIELTEHTFENALSSALKLPSASDLHEFAPMSEHAPLIVIDGVNELTIAREDWPSFTRVQLSHLVDILDRKGWKLLITTRRDRLEDILELKRSVGEKLYDPISESEHEDQTPKVSPRRADDETSEEVSLPCIRLGSYDRIEFEQLLKSYRLSPSLPFAELRHPIVFRFAAEAAESTRTAPVRVRDLFAQYFSELLRRIHARCKDRNRDRIGDLIQLWTTSNSGKAAGYISYENLRDSSNETVAEAAVAEGLFERVPGGYRYIYDEVFDYVYARSLVDDLEPKIRQGSGSVLQLLQTALDGGATYGSLARTLELLSDKFPATCRQLAEALASELRDRLAVQQSKPVYRSALLTLLWITRVLSRVEKGGPLDEAKDQLPIFTAAVQHQTGWADRSPVPFAVSDDHISYAFDEERMWRMIRLAAAKKGDSYPFRSKDVINDPTHNYAMHALEELEYLKVVRHFVTGFPDRALDRLSKGLGEREDIGFEHSFGSFCTQVLAVYSDRFDLIKLLSIDPQPHFLTLFERLARKYSDEIVSLFLDKRIGFVDRPNEAAACLGILLSVRPDFLETMVTIASQLIISYKHPVVSYAVVMPQLAEGPDRERFARLAEEEWLAGRATPGQLSDCVKAGLIPFEQSIAMCAERLRDAGGQAPVVLFEFVNNISRYLRSASDANEQTAAIDKLTTLFDLVRFDGSRWARATEALLWTAMGAKVVSTSLLDLIAKVCRNAPDAAVTMLKYPLVSSAFDDISDIEQEKICDAVMSDLTEAIAADLIMSCVKEAPNRRITQYVARRFVAKFGSDYLFTEARELADTHRELKLEPVRYFASLLQLLKDLDPDRFERDREYLK